MSAKQFSQTPSKYWYERNLISLVGFLMVVVFGISLNPPRIRWILGLAVVFILYSLLLTMTAHIFLARYAQILSPFYALLGAAFGGIIWRSVPFPALALPKLGYWLQGAAGVILVAALLLLWQSRDLRQYTSASMQAYPELTAMEGVMFNPAADNLLWTDQTIFINADVHNPTPAMTDFYLAHREDVLLWRESLLAGDLKQMGVDYLVFDHLWWASLSAPQQQKIHDPHQYERLAEWRDLAENWVALYRPIGEQQRAIYLSPVLQVFRINPQEMDFYGIVNDVGFFLYRLNLGHIPDHLMLENGWQLQFAAQSDGYQVKIFDPNGNLFDDGFVFSP